MSISTIALDNWLLGVTCIFLSVVDMMLLMLTGTADHPRPTGTASLLDFVALASKGHMATRILVHDDRTQCTPT
jgi:hypothetical protein